MTKPDLPAGIKRECQSIFDKLTRIHLVRVNDAAKLLRKTPAYIFDNFKIVKLGPKSNRVRLADLEAHVNARTIQ